MDFIEIRPRFKKITPDPVSELLPRLQGIIDDNPTELFGKIVHHHAVINIPTDQQHFWSPQLSLSFEEHEKGTLIRGMYGPKPNVWLLFMFLYFFLGFVALVALVIGISRLNLGLPAYILWSVPFILGGIFVLWFSGKTGRKLGNKQIWQIHNLLKPTILARAEDYEDW